MNFFAARFASSKRFLRPIQCDPLTEKSLFASAEEAGIAAMVRARLMISGKRAVWSCQKTIGSIFMAFLFSSSIGCVGISK